EEPYCSGRRSGEELHRSETPALVKSSAAPQKRSAAQENLRRPGEVGFIQGELRDQLVTRIDTQAGKK
ncbi:hypothetical protein U1Q18_050967, partial [Sarracenia purpurea var. burkii]